MSKKTIYLIAIIVFGIAILGTVGALQMGALRYSDACYQSIVLILGSLWFWNLIRIEDIRESRRIVR